MFSHFQWLAILAIFACLIGPCNFRGSYIQGGLKRKYKMSFVTRYYSGADQNTVGIYWFYIKLQNVIDNK